MSKILLIVESGADIPKQWLDEYPIYVLPMHVSMGDRNLDDGSFPVHEIIDYYEQTQKVPKTSATNPQEYLDLFLSLHEQYPDAVLLHLCYSAVTTASWQNALIASEELSYVYHMDTQNASGGQAFVVKKVADYLRENPDADITEVMAYAKEMTPKTHFAFVPMDLSFPRAGGRVSNVAYLGALVLNIKAMLELRDGYLVCTKKLRGNMLRVSKKIFEDVSNRYHFDTKEIFLLCSEGYPEEYQREMEAFAESMGYANWTWIKTGCVITTHGGPGAFGLVGLESENVPLDAPVQEAD